MRYVHLACTAYLTHMHTGDRSAPAIDAGGVLPGYGGIIVRDGYHAGYGHLTDALHAWCGAHLLRDLKDLYDFEPGKQDWAASMAGLLIEARDTACAARGAGLAVLDAAVLETWSPATANSPRPAWPRTSTGAPPPRGTPAGSPAGS